MTEEAKTVEQVKALQRDARKHKSEVQRHRRALRATMAKIAELKAFCRASGIAIEINGEGG